MRKLKGTAAKTIQFVCLESRIHQGMCFHHSLLACLYCIKICPFLYAFMILGTVFVSILQFFYAVSQNVHKSTLMETKLVFAWLMDEDEGNLPSAEFSVQADE